MRQTGQCYWRDEHGVLWLSASYKDDNGVVTTQMTEAQESVAVDPSMFETPSEEQALPVVALAVAPVKKPWWRWFLFWL